MLLESLFTSYSIIRKPAHDLKMATRKVFSLVFVRKASEILLGLKKRGFGQGKWNGFGGKVESGETIFQGAIRELKEECGLSVTSLKNIGVLEFEFEGNPEILEVHVFETDKFAGEVAESDEMQPRWYNVDSIPFNNMWPDDFFWFPYMLRGESFKGYFLYRGETHILKYEIKNIQNLPVQYKL